MDLRSNDGGGLLAAPDGSARWVTRVTGAFAILSGALTLLGWFFNIPRLTDWDGAGISMFPNAALCAILSGFALVLCSLRDGACRFLWFVRALGAIVAMIGLLVLFEHATSINLGIDTLIVQRSWGQTAASAPMRIGPPASTSFTLIGSALLLLLRQGSRARMVASVLGSLTVAVASLSLLGYLYGAHRLYTIPRLTGIAMQTAVVIVALGAGLIASVPQRGLAALLCAADAGGVMARRLLLPLLLASVALGWLRVSGERAGLYDSPFGSAMRTVAEVVLFIVIVWWAARGLRQAEAALRGSEKRLRKMIDTEVVGVLFFDRTGTVIDCNNAFLSMTGYSREQIASRSLHWRAMTPPEHVEISERQMEQFARTGRIGPYEKEYFRKDGSRFWMVFAGADLGDGTIIEYCIDVTERKRVEEEVRRNEAIYRRLADANLVGVGFGNSKGEVFYVNDEMLRMMGRSREDFEAGRINWAECVAPEYRETMSRAARDLLIDEQSSGYHSAFLRPDGGRTPYVGAAARVGPDDDFHVSIALDLTRIREAEAERELLLEAERAARAEAERALRMKDEFLATLSHELRTPLNAILGWSQILTRVNPGEDGDSIREGASVIARNARAQAQLIEDLLDMSRIISGKVRLDVQPVQLAAVIESVIVSAQPSADAKGIRLTKVLDPHAGPITGDPARLQQILWNLVSNAIKFTDRGGRVTLSLARVNAHVEMTVADTGQGIAPEFLPHVFERFRQQDASTTRRHGGLGLGLSIVKQLVELHGGKVSVRSAGVGKGASFAVELPLAAVHPADSQDECSEKREHPAAVRRLSPDGDTPELEHLKVLVVDDEPDAATLVKRLLEECGARVVTALDADEALRQFAAEKPDLVLSDIGMPGKDGYDMIRAVRELERGKDRQTPAVALTAFARSEDRMRALQAGYQMHVSKPVEPAELITVVASLAGKLPEQRNRA